jgi:hypothetical protein
VPRKKSEVVEELIEKMEKRLTAEGGFKASLADYIRLIQLQKELEEDEPRDIEVKWVDPERTYGDSEA